MCVIIYQKRSKIDVSVSTVTQAVGVTAGGGTLTGAQLTAKFTPTNGIDGIHLGTAPQEAQGATFTIDLSAVTLTNLTSADQTVTIAIVSRCRKYDPMHISRNAKAAGDALPTPQKYIFEVWKIYNGSSKTHTLPLKF